MKNLLNFLIKYNYWFLFILLEVISFTLLFRFNQYQASTFFTTSNQIVGETYEISSGITSYFHLKSINTELLDKNIYLEQQVALLQKTLAARGMDSLQIDELNDSVLNGYTIINAEVINNSLNKPDNYITLNKGLKDGIRPEMGIINGNGVVGIIYMASPHYSVAIPILNSKSSISCKIKNTDFFGYLKWEGNDSGYAYVKDLPRHAKFSLGDSIITSGYSTVFPSGVMIGTIDDLSDSHDGLSYRLKIKLSTDFGKLSDVRIIAKNRQREQHDLEERAEKQ